ncbi:MAG: WecB/TagA/CpsF family glycosyltransferase [Chloroflexi bacterium]|nr:WecB/TagA/CpsF family glycosyltransferase [Chloroflexota bacterium]
MAIEVLVSKGSAPPPSLLDEVAAAEPVESHRRRVELGGILLDQVDLAAAVDRIAAFVRSGQPHHVVTVNLDFLSIANRNPEFEATLNGADLAVADGMPLVWLSRLRSERLEERVAGVELVMESRRMGAELGSSVFLLGAAPGVAEAAGKRIQESYPGIRIAGTYAPPVGALTAQENRYIIDLIRLAAPDFLFVALGAPRQDLWIREHLTELRVPVAMGVGCVLDLLAGNVRRAPAWMQRGGLEWAFRLVQEPGRLWRRYLVNDLPLLARLTLAGPEAKATEALSA